MKKKTKLITASVIIGLIVLICVVGLIVKLTRSSGGESEEQKVADAASVVDDVADTSDTQSTSDTQDTSGDSKGGEDTADANKTEQDSGDPAPIGEARITAPALVKTAMKYDYDYETKDWALNSVTEYEYENAYPVSITTKDADGQVTSTETMKYEFDGAVPASMVKDDGIFTYKITYKNGQVYDVEFENADKTQKGYKIYQYGGSDEYFTFVLHSSDFSDPNYPEDGSCMEEVDSIVVKEKDGLLVQTTNSGTYVNWNLSGGERVWSRFNGTYTLYYDADGIAHHSFTVFRAGTDSGSVNIDLTVENGRVTEAVSKSVYDDGTPDQLQFKYEFEYTDTEISKARYASMINDFMMSENNYYIFNWY